MILEWFVDFVLSLFLQVLLLIPFPDSLDLGAFSAAFGIMGTFNSIFPVTEAIQGAGVVLALTGVLFIYRVIKTAAAHIPLVGGTG